MSASIWLAVCALALHLAACAPDRNSAQALTATPAATLTPTQVLTLPPPPAITETAKPEIATPSPAPTVLPTGTEIPCASRPGRFEQHGLPVDGMNYSVNVRVYVPPCYDSNLATRYPVLYLFHGFRYTDDQWQRLGVGETIEALVAAGEIPPFIVVMPLDRENTEPDENPLDLVFIDNILPWVDGHYRTLADRQYRAVGGLSRGAGWAVHFGLRNWEYFGTVGAHSLALFWYDSRYFTEWLDAIPTNQRPRFYLDMGSSDAQLNAILYSFLEELNRRNIPHEWHLFHGFHDEAYWRKHLEFYLRWYAAGWADLIP